MYYCFSNPDYASYQRHVTELFFGSKLEPCNLVIQQFMGYNGHVSPKKHKTTKRPFIPTNKETLGNIRELASGCQGPSSIQEEITEKQGGIIDCESTSCLPRNIQHVKRIRNLLKASDNNNSLQSLICYCRETNQISLSWTPHPRVVFSTKGQLESIVEYCTGPGKKSIFAIDTVFNIGDYYVTSTTYQNPYLLNTRTNKHANLPGPAMFHVTQQRIDFMHFSHSLIEKNESFENLNFVGGDRSVAQKGFLFPLKLCTFLPCMMHMKDDITHFLKEHALEKMK